MGGETQFEDSISFRIQGEAKYGQSPGKCLLKFLAILQLNGEGAFPVCLRWLSIGRWKLEPESVPL